MSCHGRKLVSAVACAAWYAAVCVFGIAGLSSVTHAQTTQCNITLAWDPNPEPNIASYKLSWGLAARTYSHSVTVWKEVVKQTIPVPEGRTYYFTVQATDGTGAISGYSNEVVAVVPVGCGTSGVVYRIPGRILGVVSVVIQQGT